MADNLAVTAGTGTTIATDQVGAAHYQKIKIFDGTADSENGLVVDSSGNAMVKLAAGTAAVGKLAANSGVDIGDVDVTSCALPTGAATETTLGTIHGHVDSIDTKLPTLGQALAAASVPVVLTAAQQTALTPPAAITGFATETTLGTVHGHVDSIDGKITACNTGAVVLAAGTAGIGKLTANSGVDIGDVDVLSLPAAPPPDKDITTHTNYARKYYTSAGAATDGIIWSPAAGKRWHVTSLYFQVSADATVTFEDDKAGGDDPVLKGEYKAGSGVALTFDEKYPFASGEDASDLTVTTTAGNIYVAVCGYEV